ncbi:MAG: tRNA dihydrouridine synthase DusB [Pseudomonadota bacterium]
MQLAGITIKSPFLAAPMAGVSSPPFRLLAARAGAGLVYTEMVSAVALLRRQPQTVRMARVLPEERPVALQLFGQEPEAMAGAARRVAAMDVDLVDINMGCPARKVRRQGAGSALLDEPAKAAEILRAVVENCPQPVTVKLRLGYKSETLEEVLPGLIAAGAKAVCLHARTVVQGFSGRADWSAIARLKSWCPLPVIGNGDVRSAEGALAMLAATGCDAVMIGRAAMGDPWIFSRAADLLAGRAPTPVSLSERRAALWEHAEPARRLQGEGGAVHFMRQFMMWYAKGLPGATEFRREAGPVRDLGQLMRLAGEFFDGLERAA